MVMLIKPENWGTRILHDWKITVFRNDSNNWNKVVLSLPGCDVYDTVEYHQLTSRHSGHCPCLLFFEMTKSKHYKIAIPMVFRTIDSRLCGQRGWIDSSSIYGLSGPFANWETIPQNIIRSFQDTLRACLVEMGVVSVFSRLNPFRTNDNLINTIGEIIEVGKLVTVDLTCDNEVRFRSYRKNHQENIFKLRSLQGKTIHDKNFSKIQEFKNIYYGNMDRVKAKPYYYFEPAYFDSIVNLMAEHTYLLLNQIRAVSTCGGLFFRFGDRVHAHLAATSDEFRNLAPLKQLFDDAACLFRAEGCRVMNIGGGVRGQDDSLLHFKSGFSDTFLPFKVWKWIVNQAGYKELICGQVQNNAHFPSYRSEADLV